MKSRMPLRLTKIKVAELVQPEEEKDTKKGNVMYALRPFLLFITIFGVFNPIPTLYEDQSTHEKAHRVYRRIGQFFVVGSIFNFFRHLTSFIDCKEFEAAIPRLLLLLFFLQCAVNSFALFQFSHHGRPFLLEFRKISQISASKIESFRKASLFAAILVAVMVVSNVTFFGYALYNVDFFDNAIAPYNTKDSIGNCIKGIYLVYKIFLGGYWMSMCFLEVLVGRMINSELNTFCKDLSSNFISDERVDMEDLRQRYTGLCELVAKANDLFKTYNGIELLTSMLHMLLLSYSLVWFPNTRARCLVFLAHMFWICAVTGKLVANTISCSMVNHTVRKPLQILYRIKLRTVSTDFSLQYSTLMTQVLDSKTGLSAMNFFLIDKTTILNITGMLATYFIVLIQFNQTAPEGLEVKFICSEFSE